MTLIISELHVTSMKPAAAGRMYQHLSSHVYPGARLFLTAAVTLVVALLGVALPALWFGERAGRGTPAAVGPAADQSPAPNAGSSTSFERARASTFFGFLEFDWDPDAPGGVPGFDPWPGISQSETRWNRDEPAFRSLSHASHSWGDPATFRDRLADPTLATRPAQEIPRIAVEFLAGSARWSDADSRRALLRGVSQWLTDNYGFPSTLELPRIVQVARAQISAMRYGPILSGVPQESLSASDEDQLTTLAIYLDNERTIYLTEEFNGSTPAELSILVHEMVHHVQNGQALRYECPQAREKPAYLAQQRWLQQFGQDLSSEFQMDSMTFLLKSACIH